MTILPEIVGPTLFTVKDGSITGGPVFYGKKEENKE
jgi:hypothetical protein